MNWEQQGTQEVRTSENPPLNSVMQNWNDLEMQLCAKYNQQSVFLNSKPRLKNEYNVDIKMDRLAFRYVRWIESYDGDIERLNLTSDAKKVKDFKDRDLIIFQNDWGINWALDHNKGLVLSGVGKDEE